MRRGAFLALITLCPGIPHSAQVPGSTMGDTFGPCVLSGAAWSHASAREGRTQERVSCVLRALALRGGVSRSLDSDEDHERWAKIRKQEQRGRKKLERIGLKGRASYV